MPKVPWKYQNPYWWLIILKFLHDAQPFSYCIIITKIKSTEKYQVIILSITLAALKQKRPFRRNGLTSNDCLPYENF